MVKEGTGGFEWWHFFLEWCYIGFIAGFAGVFFERFLGVERVEVWWVIVMVMGRKCGNVALGCCGSTSP